MWKMKMRILTVSLESKPCWISPRILIIPCRVKASRLEVSRASLCFETGYPSTGLPQADRYSGEGTAIRFAGT